LWEGLPSRVMYCLFTPDRGWEAAPTIKPTI
jgi:hypothetical protein